MSSIDRRVVEAQFDNAQFERGVKTTLNSLDNLKKGLNMDGASRGLDGISGAAGRVTHGLNVMRVAAYTAIATIAHQATLAGEQFVKSFTVGPLLDGLHEYETQLGSIQTILSNTQWQHTTLKDVNAALNQLNHYSDKTIYNFSEMARNIGTFTAAGVKLDTSVNAIKGIANLAAVSGSNAQQASTAMYQLSQALASGTVKLMDWNSVVNAGMGGKVFQDALMETARIHGVAVDKMIKKDGSFRNTLQRGWLTSKILTETLAKFTGDETREQLKQQGYTEKQINQIEKLGKMATDAATKVKTGTQLINTLQETAGSGWAKTWQIVIGNFNEAKDLWTGVNNVVGGALTRMAKARNKVLSDWKDLGGRDAMLDGIKSAVQALGSVIKPIHDAFRDVFPAKTGKQLYEMTVAFKNFMDNLKIGADTADNLRRTFAGFFAVLDIGWQVVKAGIKFIADLFGAVTEGEGSGGFLGATANIGDFLVALDKAIKKGDGLTKFFHGLERILAGPIALLKAVASAIFSIFDFNAPSADKITKAFNPLTSVGNALFTVWDGIWRVLGKVFTLAMHLGGAVAKVFAGLGSAISDAMGGLNFEDVLHTINTGLLAGIVLLIRKFVNHFTSGGANPVKGLVDAIKSPFTELTGTLQQMQHTLRATTLLQIAAAVGILAASVIGLSRIDAAGLTRALTAIAGLFTQLFVSLALFGRIGGPEGLITAGAGLILFATAIRVLTSSVKALSGMNWEDLAKGLTGVTVLIGGLTLAAKGMSGNAGGMISAGAGLLILSAAIKVLASAITDISGLSWGQIAKGLTGVSAVLLALTLFTKFAEVNRGGIAQGAGLVLLGAAIKILASAVGDFAATSWQGLSKGLVVLTGILGAVVIFSKTVGNPLSLMASGTALIAIGTAMLILAKAMDRFGGMNWTQIAKGLVAMAGALTLIAVAMNAMPISSLLSAAALVAVSIALGQIADALGNMGGLSWDEIAHGLVTLAGSLVIIAAAMYGMTGTLAGAAALLVVAGALRIFVPTLIAMGNMSWGNIAKGLITLAAAFAIIGVAGLALTPVVPGLLGLGAAIVLLGAGMALAGAGVLAFATGLTALAGAGAAAVVAVVGIVTGLLGAIPGIAKTLGLALVAISVAVGSAVPAMAKAIGKVLDAILNVIIKESPKIIKTFGHMMVDLLQEMEKDVPKMARSALQMMIGILKALEDKEPQIVKEMINLVVGLLNSLAKGTPKMVAAATNLMVAFLEGIAKHIDEVITAGTDIIIAWIKGIGKNAVRIANAAMDTVIDFVNGLADAIETHIPEFRDAGKHIAFAIADGMTLGLASKVKDVASKAKDLASSALHSAGHFLGIGSPSKEFWKVGKWSVEGFANGIKDNTPTAVKASKDMAKSALEAASKEFRQAVKFIHDPDFVKGLVGGKDDVKSTLSATRDVLHAAMQRAHEDMKQAQQDLKDLKAARDDDNKAVKQAKQDVDDATAALAKLQNAKKQDHDAIKQAQRDLDDTKDKLHEAKKARREDNDEIDKTQRKLHATTKEYEAAKNAFDKFTQAMEQQKKNLKALGALYDEYTVKINDAKAALQAAIQVRDDFNKQITEQYGALPDISEDTSVDAYIDNLQKQIDDTQEFMLKLQQLRDAGLNDDMYKELLAKGPDALPFIDSVIDGGQEAIDKLNELDSELQAQAKALGNTASKELYQAGVDAARGILQGLKDERKNIEDMMKYIADNMQATLKKALKIKSPSKVMQAIGTAIIAGIGVGMKDAEPDLQKILHGIGKRLVATVKAYVDQANALLGSVGGTTPTPVIDLPTASSSIITNSIPMIAVDKSLATAKATSTEMSVIKDALKTDPAPPSTQTVTLVQNNYSPKALSAAEIYRQTNSQLSKAKGALATNAS